MTTFVFTWNSAFLAAPTDTEQESLGASRIRDFKNAFSERFEVCFSLNGDANDGLLTNAQFLVQGTAPTTGPGLYTFENTTTNNNELYFLDNNGHTTQLTAGGTVNFTTPLPSGTVMSFLQAAVPVGWTQNTGFNDKVIRLVSGAGAGVGGAWAISGLQDAGCVLNVYQMPSHTHSYNAATLSTGSQLNSGSPFTISSAAGTTGSTGGNEPHYTTITGDGTWRPAYVNACVGVKN